MNNPEVPPINAPAAAPAPTVPATPAVDPAPATPEPPYIAKLFDDVMGVKTDPKKVEPPKGQDLKDVVDPAAKAADLTPDPAKPADPEVKADPKPVQPKRTRVGPKPRTDSEIVAVAAAAAAKAVKESKHEPPPPVPVAAPSEPDIPEMFARKAEVFRALADVDPEKYGSGRIQKILKKSASDIQAYAQAYSRENGGKRFNPSDPEHSEAIEELSPNIDEEDMVAARVSVQTAKAVEAQMKPIREQMDSRKKQEELAQIVEETSKVARSSAVRVSETVISGLDPEIASAIMDEGKFNDFKKSNPGQAKIITDASERYLPLVYKAVQMMSPGGEKTINAANDPLRDAVFSNLLPAVDKYAMSGPNEGIDDKGRAYLPLSEFAELSASEAKNHWTLNIGLVELYAAEAIKHEIAAANAALEKQIADMGYVKKGSVSAPKTPPKEDKPQTIATKSASPSISSGGPTIVSGTPAISSKNVYDKMFQGAMGGA